MDLDVNKTNVVTLLQYEFHIMVINRNPGRKKTQIHAFFISNFFISNTMLNWQKKIKQILSNAVRLTYCYLKIIEILHARYHPKITGYTL